MKTGKVAVENKPVPAAPLSFASALVRAETREKSVLPLRNRRKLIVGKDYIFVFKLQAEPSEKRVLRLHPVPAASLSVACALPRDVSVQQLSVQPVRQAERSLRKLSVSLKAVLCC